MRKCNKVHTLMGVGSLALLFALTACQSQAPQSDPAALGTLPEAPAGNVEFYVHHLSTLASDAFEGRAPGTRGERLTLDHLVSAYEALGLAPGYGESYLQPVPMVEQTNELRSELSFVTGDAAWQLVYPEQMIINSRRLGQQVHGIQDSEVVFVGYGVNAPEYGWNDYEGLDVRGKTVVMLVNDPGFATGDPTRFNGRAMTYYGRWTYKYEEAARQGAAAALIVHDTEPASYPWEVVTNSWSMPQFELGVASDEPVLTLEGWITLDGARELFARAGHDFDAAYARAAQPGFEAIALNTTLSAEARNRVREGTSYNAVAMLPGTERPEELIVYMAHWDHLGRTLNIPGSAGIYNGAVDNASGTAGLLEIARMYAEAGAPERSVMFLAVTLEEYGLLGSRYYANFPIVPTNQTVAAINMDAMTLIGPTEDVVVIGYGSSELEDILKQAVVAQNRRVVPEPTPEGGFYYRSDHFNFARVGVPALYAKGGVIHREHGEAYGVEQSRIYRDLRYHKPADEVQADWDYQGVMEDLQLLYVVGRAVADSDQWPSWYAGNEFKAIRDRDLLNRR